MGGARQRTSGRERGADLRFNMEITLEEAYAGKTAQVRLPTSVTCEVLLRLRRQGRHQAEDLPALQRPWPHPPHPGRLLHARAHLSDLPGPRPGHRGPVPDLLGLGPGDARAHAFGQHPAGCRGRHAHPSRQRRRGRRARRAAGRSLYFPFARRACVLPARRRRPALPRADLDGHRGAGRRVRGAVDRRQQGARSRCRAARNPGGASA